MLRRLTGALLVSAGVAACGSSADTRTARPSAAPSTSPRALHRPPEVPENRMPRHAPRGATAEITGGFTISATMTIHSGDRLSPPVIALPTFRSTTLKLTLRDGDRHPHTLAFGTHRVRVPRRGHVLLTIHHLAKGSHEVTVDGHPGGKLTVGSQGGP